MSNDDSKAICPFNLGEFPWYIRPWCSAVALRFFCIIKANDT